MIDNQFLLEKCKALIETQIAWGDSSSWQIRDFENLSERIFETTGVVLSTSTLKRIWGKVSYSGKPNLATLDALALFAGFENWRAFVAANQPNGSRGQKSSAAKKYLRPAILLVTLLILAGGFAAGFVFMRKTSAILSYTDITFSSKPVTLGVPNTVIFNYDASQSNADSVLIQQDWDERKKVKVDKQKQVYAGTYYFPGYHRAKLLLNDSIVKEHDVYIESPGWIGLIYKEPMPLYLPDKMYKHDDWLGITEKDLQNYQTNPSSSASPPLFILTKVSKEFNVSSDNFALNLELQNTADRAEAPCRFINIMLLGSEGVINIPLSAPGCVGELKMMLGKKTIDGTLNNLSALGVDFTKPVRFSCTAVFNKISINLNGRVAYEEPFDSGIGKIVGIRVAFKGSGQMKFVELKNAI